MPQHADLAEASEHVIAETRLEEMLPPHWRLPAPVDAGVMQSLAEGLLVETVLAVADQTVAAPMGHASYLYLTDVLERGIAHLMAVGWPVYNALQGVARCLNVVIHLDGFTEEPGVARFVDWCRVEAERHRSGEPMRQWIE